MEYQHQIGLGLMAGAAIGILWHQLLVLRRSRGIARGSSRPRSASRVGNGTPTIQPVPTLDSGKSWMATSTPFEIPSRRTYNGYSGSAANVGCRGPSARTAAPTDWRDDWSMP